MLKDLRKMNNSRLFLWINKKKVPQGKLFKVYGNRWIYLADIDENKFYEKFQRSLAIAVRILEAITKAKINCSILYRYKKQGIVYWARKSDFYNFGILRADGGHRQYLLPLNKWRVWKEPIGEPFNLPDVSVDKWAESGDTPRIVEDASIPFSVLDEIKKRNPALVESLRS